MQSENTTVKEPKKRWTKEMFIQAFIKGTLGKKHTEGNWRVFRSGLVEKLEYQATGEGYGRRWASQPQSHENMRETLAVKMPDGLILSNANRLRFIGSHMAWGTRARAWQDTAEQQLMVKEGAMPVPFSVFEAAKLDLTTIRVVEKAPAEQVTVEVNDIYDDKLGRYRMKLEDRHYVGACLLESEGQYFLFDIDRRELANRIFNPFVVKLARPAVSIEDAYASLKPQKFLDAVAQNLDVARQGEWFFIKRYGELPELAPVPADLQARVDNPPHIHDFQPDVVLGEAYKAGDHWGYHGSDTVPDAYYRFACTAWEEDKEAALQYAPREGSLQQGSSRPNRVTRFVKHEDMVLVSGTVSHTGREHKDLELVGWWEAVPNTAVGAWQVSGEID